MFRWFEGSCIDRRRNQRACVDRQRLQSGAERHFMEVTTTCKVDTVLGPCPARHLAPGRYSPPPSLESVHQNVEQG
jgi:hypothetical protein